MRVLSPRAFVSVIWYADWKVSNGPGWTAGGMSTRASFVKPPTGSSSSVRRRRASYVKREVLVRGSVNVLSSPLAWLVSVKLLAGRIGDCAEKAVAVDGQRRVLAKRRRDAGWITGGVVADCRDVAIAVCNGRQPAAAVVAEAVECRRSMPEAYAGGGHRC